MLALYVEQPLHIYLNVMGIVYARQLRELYRDIGVDIKFETFYQNRAAFNI